VIAGVAASERRVDAMLPDSATRARRSLRHNGSMRTIQTWMIVSCAALVVTACGDDGGDGGAPDAADGADAADNADAADLGPCPADTLCLRPTSVTPGGEIPAGRVGVVWFQLNDDGIDPEIEIGFDAPLDPSAARIDIPVGDITGPGEENLVCERACPDETMCPCLGKIQIGFAFVIAVVDVNGNGAIDVPDDVGISNDVGIYGVGFMAVGFSETAYDPAPSPFEALFPDGIQGGIAPYEVIENAGSFDTLGVPDEPQIYEFTVCVPGDATCDDLRLPNLT
jgi:hypothetical protein